MKYIYVGVCVCERERERERDDTQNAQSLRVFITDKRESL